MALKWHTYLQGFVGGGLIWWEYTQRWTVRLKSAICQKMLVNLWKL